MPGTCENDVLERLDSLSEKEFVEKFVANLIPVLEHSKEEISEFLQTKSVAILKQVRILTFNELVSKLPAYADRELYARRKTDNLIEDIYVFAYSAVNGLADERLSRCLKPLLVLENTISKDTQSQEAQDPQTECQDLHSLLDMCLKLKDKVIKLENTVREQNIRITELERHHIITHMSELERDKVTLEEGAPTEIRDDSLPQDNLRPGTQSSLREEKEKVSRPNEKLAAKKKSVTAKGPSEGTSTVNSIDTPPQEQGKQKPTTDKVQPRLKAAVADGNLSQGTLNLYVGKLDVNTREHDLMEHLSDIPAEDILNVKPLNGKNRTSSSFCLSFRNASSYEKALSSTWWPSGVIVRQFKQSVGKRLQAASRKRHFKHIDSWSYERPAKPRYHRNRRHDLYYRSDGWDCVGHNNEYDRFGDWSDGYYGSDREDYDWMWYIRNNKVDF